MLVFIDESGDPGFKIDQGSSPYFVVAMVIFEDVVAAQITQAAIVGSEARRIHKGEFKFNKTRQDVRDLYFQSVRGSPFSIRAIVVRKDLLSSPGHAANGDTLHTFFLKQLIRRARSRLIDAKIVIDGFGARAFRRHLATALRRDLPPGLAKSWELSDSKNDDLVQLADMCVGAIARSLREDRSDSSRWRKMLAERIEDIWNFGSRLPGS